MQHLCRNDVFRTRRAFCDFCHWLNNGAWEVASSLLQARGDSKGVQWVTQLLTAVYHAK